MSPAAYTRWRPDQEDSPAARSVTARPVDEVAAQPPVALPSREVVLEDDRVSNRVSTLVSALCLLPGTLVLWVGIREYRSGSSAGWAVAGVAIFLGSAYALVRDLRHLRSHPDD
jgi:hypothetical protein